MLKVSATKIRNNFSHYLNLVAYGKENIVIEKMGKPFALITSVKNQKEKSFDREKTLKAIEKSAGILGSFKNKNIDMRNLFRKMKENYDD